MYNHLDRYPDTSSKYGCGSGSSIWKTFPDPQTCSLHSLRSVYPEIVNYNAGKVFHPCEHKLSLSYPPLWINIWTGFHTLYVLYTTQVIYYWFSFPSGSVVDPDPYVFGPTGSGSVIICTDSSLFVWILPPTSKNNKKNLDFYCFLTSFWHFIFEDWCKCTVKE